MYKSRSIFKATSLFQSVLKVWTLLLHHNVSQVLYVIFYFLLNRVIRNSIINKDQMYESISAQMYVFLVKIIFTEMMTTFKFKFNVFYNVILYFGNQKHQDDF